MSTCLAESVVQHGVSDASQDFVRRFRDVRQHQARTVSFGWRDLLKGRVSEVARECKESGWDGYRARPVTRLSELAAFAFIDLLPGNIVEPDIVPEPTGYVGFEWRVGTDRVLVASAGEEGIAYATILGSRRHHGEEPFIDEIPEILAAILADHFRKI